MRAKGISERIELFLRAQVRIEPGVVAEIVAVQAAGPRGQE